MQIVAKIVMLVWDRLFNQQLSLTVPEVEVKLYQRYVDDLNMAAKIPRITQQQDNKTLEDKAVQIKQIADTVLPGTITMEIDLPQYHTNNKLPILDLECWVRNNQILHQFYRKPVASTRVIMARSAFSKSVKRSVCIQLAVRRILNCSPELPWQVKASFLSELALCMRESGHSTRFIREIIARAIASTDKIYKEKPG